MFKSRNIILFHLLIVACLWGIREYHISSNAASRGGIGPDVIVGSIPDIARWGNDSDETAFSIATTSCNIGDERLDWISNSPIHPVISQNMYRLNEDGRFEQIGMSWLKHGFAVAAGSLCNQCTDPAGNYLGVGCSDPYGASLNGSHSRLGPRSQVNATTGVFTWPKGNLPQTGTLDGRIRVLTADLNPALNPNAQYFVESQYVHPQDAGNGNGNNSVSYRQAFVSSAGGSNWDVNVGSPPTVREQPAINAWKAAIPEVQLFVVDVPDDGRFVVGMLTTELPGNAGYHTEFAIENLTSHQSMRSLGVRYGSDSISGAGFHDVDYQYEPYSGTDWPSTIVGNSIVWTTEAFSVNQNANALRWNTVYSFWCDSELPPRGLTLGMFRPGTVSEMEIELVPTLVGADHKLEDGASTGGQYSDIFVSDNQYWELDPLPTINPRKQRVSFYLQATSPTSTPTDFGFRLESAISGGPSGDVIQSIEFFNYNTGLFEFVDVRPAVTSDQPLEVSPTGDWSRFFHGKSNEVNVRVIWTTEGGFAGTPYDWAVDVDEAVWLIAE